MSQAHRYEQILSAAVLNRLEANIRIQVPGQTWGVRDHVSPWQNPRLDLEGWTPSECAPIARYHKASGRSRPFRMQLLTLVSEIGPVVRFAGHEIGVSPCQC